MDYIIIVKNKIIQIQIRKTKMDLEGTKFFEFFQKNSC